MDEPGGPTNPDGLVNNRLGQPSEIGRVQRELPTATYRIDTDGTVTRVVDEAAVPDPNGLAFSPDQDRLYITSTGKGPGDQGPGGEGMIFVFDVADGQATNGRLFRPHAGHVRHKALDDCTAWAENDLNNNGSAGSLLS